jgi:hypothetical protein
VTAEAAEIAGVEMKLPSKEREVRVIQFGATGDALRPTVLLLHGAGGFVIADYRLQALRVSARQ